MQRLGYGALALTLFSIASPVLAQKPGDLYREWAWRPIPWQRVTGSDATDARARAALPNPVNSIPIAHLSGAIRVEAQIEKLTSHCGTLNARMRVNGNAWLPIPEPEGVPGTFGTGSTSENYNCMYFPKVEIPLSHLRSGGNTFEFDCSRGYGFSSLWPQFIIYGVTFRVFYDERNAYRHPTGRIVSPVSGTVFGDAFPEFEVEGSQDIVEVEFLGDYDDYGWRGEEASDGWQYSRLYDKVINNIGDATAAPWKTTWDTTWIPTQPKPFRVVARLKNSRGYYRITEPITGLSFARSKKVRRHRLTQIPQVWTTNYWAPEHKAALILPADISKREAVRMVMGTWNGYQSEQIGIGNRRLATSVGKDHDLDWTVLDGISKNAVVGGFNQVYTRCDVQDHGPEFLWPGIEVFIRYDEPEAEALFTKFGTACASQTASPVIGNTGLPNIGSTYSIDLNGAAPTQPYWFIFGLYANRDRNNVPLPLELTFMGMPGCSLYTSIHRVWSGSTDATGHASFAINVPNMSQLTGAHFYSQYLTLAPGANTLGVLATDGGRSLIGQ